MKAPMMFTVKGWIMLPFAVLIRVPFIAFKIFALGIIKLNKFNENMLNGLPKPEQNPAYNEFYNEKARQAIMARFNRG